MLGPITNVKLNDVAWNALWNVRESAHLEIEVRHGVVGDRNGDLGVACRREKHLVYFAYLCTNILIIITNLPLYNISKGTTFSIHHTTYKYNPWSFCRPPRLVT